MKEKKINGRDFLHNLNIDEQDKQTLCVVIGTLCTEVAAKTAKEIISVINPKWEEDPEISQLINGIANREVQPIIDALYNDIK